jgi:hypothetical protein
MVVPHSNFPLSAFSLPFIISKKLVTASGSLLKKAIFSPFVDAETYFIKQLSAINTLA